MTFDHAVVYVPNLSQAINNFTQLGFIVVPGGEHNHTHNALIIFNDRSYVELLSLKPTWYRPLLRLTAVMGLIACLADRRTDVSWRFMRWITQSYGAVDWCVRVDNVDAALDQLKPINVPTLKSQMQFRRRPDGKIARWMLGSPKDLDLPFLISDVTAAEIRAPLGEHTKHPNGAQRVKQINISLDGTRGDSQRSVNRLKTFLSVSAGDKNTGKDIFTLENITVCIAKKPNTAGRFSLELSYDGDSRQQLDNSTTCGITVWLSPDH